MNVTSTEGDGKGYDGRKDVGREELETLRRLGVPEKVKGCGVALFRLSFGASGALG